MSGKFKVGGLLALCLVVIIGAGVFVYKSEATRSKVFGTNYTNFTDLQVDNDLLVVGSTTFSGATTLSGAATLSATTTVQELTYGSRYATALTFSATATTTPGGLGSITNTGATKICDRVEIDLTTGSTVGGREGTGVPLDFSVATSTALGIGNGTNLIATSTVATSTTALLDTVVNKGSGVEVAAQSFLWGAGEVLLFTFDEHSGDAATSTASFTGMAGNAYVRCHTR